MSCTISVSYPLKRLVISISLILGIIPAVPAVPAATMPQSVSPCGAPAQFNPLNLRLYRAIVMPIVEKMTLQQKIGQMTLTDLSMLPTQADHYSAPHLIDPALMSQYAVGALLVAGDETPYTCTGERCTAINNATIPGIYEHAIAANWLALANEVGKSNVSVTIGKDNVALIAPLLGTDAVHGNQHVVDQVLFPQNIGLAATHDPAEFYQAGYWTAQSVRATGFNWIFAPTLAVSHNPNWGRYYETMGSDPDLVKTYAYCFVQGAQQSSGGFMHGTLATAKHYLGDGATLNGIDEGNDSVSDLDRFYRVNSAGYIGAINASVGSSMISYSAVNGLPMSINSTLFSSLYTGQLNGQIYHAPFYGFAVSDYAAVNRIATQGLPTTTNARPSFNQAMADTINAGMDMIMLSPWTENSTIDNFQKLVTGLVANADKKKAPAIDMNRINEAVVRILAVKYAMGLITNPDGTIWHTQRTLLSTVNDDPNNDKAAQAALQAAQKSLVLLKNKDSVLPIQPQQLQYIVLVGEDIIPVQQGTKPQPELFQTFNNIGAQNGGWSLRWQGYEGNEYWLGTHQKMTHASSIVGGISQIVAPYKTQVLYTHYTEPTINMDAVKVQRAQFMAQLKQLLPKMTPHNTVIIASLAEPPYAEFMGDINVPYCANETSSITKGCLYNMHQNPYLPKQQKSTSAVGLDQYSQSIIQLLHEKDTKIPVVSILFSGRPVVINETINQFNPLNDSAAFIAAWLPGTTGGQAIANALFGRYLFCNGKALMNGACPSHSANTLPVDWLKDMSQLTNYPVYSKGIGVPRYSNPLFAMGYGLATTTLSEDKSV